MSFLFHDLVIVFGSIFLGMLITDSIERLFFKEQKINIKNKK
jgi:hypothetical protein